MTGGELPGVVLVCREEVVLEAEVMAGEVQEGAEVEAEEIQGVVEVVVEEIQGEEVLWRWGEQQGDLGLAEVVEVVKVEEEE